MLLAFLDRTELFTFPWLALMLIGLIAPAAAIRVARARFGRRARPQAAANFLIVDLFALLMAILVHGDNPFPMPTVELAPVGVILAVITTFRRAKVLPAGICRVCGYDLRATPERCPECGTVPTLGEGGTE